ncbi:hypothetical protein ACFQZI_04195 [Mucilaginibacter lutimaris]|uniref:Uncharacterized protein n=1 Tax=Mucilaginibacter lutimaris TaxID=931629 RepID=A0ABW2ZCY8_9SPHI
MPLPYRYKKLTYWILLTNCLIIVGAGHGVAPMIFFEIFVPFNLGADGFEFCIGNCNYEKSILLSAILCFCGQILLLIANSEESRVTRTFGLVFMWLGLYNLCHNFDDMAGITLSFALPFIVTTLYFLFFSTKDVIDRRKANEL